MLGSGAESLQGKEAMKYLSLFSGIEAASSAWNPLGWECVGVSEIEPFPCAVLKHHYPKVPNFGDITQHETWTLPEGIDLIVGGSPCQSFSVAGKRGGLDDPRGRLMHDYVAVVERVRPRWIVWENVPGVLSSGNGRDFAALIGSLEKLGFGCAWRILDAQWFGVPQRRRRVFLVGCLGNWTAAASVLFERESLCGHPPSREQARQGAASDAGGGAKGGCVTSHAVAPCLETTCNDYSRADGFTMIGQPQQANTLNQFDTGERDTHAVAFNWQNGGGYGNANEGLGITVEGTGPLQRCNTPAVAVGVDLYNQEITGQVHCPLRTAGGHGAPAVALPMTVRRLTPRECERLQGFPDDWTLIPYRNKPAELCPDGPRYKALGNSMAVPCMRWIGERIAGFYA